MLMSHPHSVPRVKSRESTENTVQTISVYADASWDRYTKIAALGVVTCTGEYTREKSSFFGEKFVHNTNMYEVEAISLALSAATTLAHKGDVVKIFSDSIYAINIIKKYLYSISSFMKDKDNKEKMTKQVKSALKKVKSLQKNGIRVSFVHKKISEEQGIKSAHNIANYTRKHASKEMSKRECVNKCKHVSALVKAVHDEREQQEQQTKEIANSKFKEYSWS